MELKRFDITCKKNTRKEKQTEQSQKADPVYFHFPVYQT